MKSLRHLARSCRNLYLKRNFFIAGAVLSVMLACSFVWQVLFFPAVALLGVLGIFTLTDVLLLFSKEELLSAERSMTRILSLGDVNTIQLRVKNLSSLKFHAEILEEFPEQLQIRDLVFPVILEGNEDRLVEYDIRPTARALLQFGKTNVLVSSFLQLVERRVELETEGTVAVYPSVIQMKKYELRNMQKTARYYGVKKLRRIGHSYEFEQIKNYVQGDDFRHINWKATGKLSNLMMNQYVEEKSQQVYCIIDKSRNMMMPFDGINLLDYAINTCLVLSNIALGKDDKAGLITFSDKVETTLKAQNRPGQLTRIIEQLYNERSTYTESNYEALYQVMRRQVPNRSMVFLFTNFESLYNMQRNLSVLRRLARQHLLVVVFFENTEISRFMQASADSIQDIYTQTIAKKFSQEKWLMVQELSRHGIMSIYTKPEDLTINSINRYLEIKSKGML